jgi:hypothetical protein
MLKTFVQLSLPDGRTKTLDYSIDEMDKKVSRAFRHWKLNGRPITEKDIRHRQSVMNINNGNLMTFIIYFSHEKENWNIELTLKSTREKFQEFTVRFNGFSYEKIADILENYSSNYIS